MVFNIVCFLIGFVAGYYCVDKLVPKVITWYARVKEIIKNL